MTCVQYPDLANTSVVVSGGASGIGRAIAEAFLSQRCKVAFLDHNEIQANDFAKSENSPALSFFRCDLTDSAALANACHEISEELGPVSTVVNNAANDARHTFLEVTPERWDELMAVNLKHQFFVSKAFVPEMIEAGRGAIINLSSISWRRGVVGLPIYVTAKAAVEGMTRALARELGPKGVRVNALLPGMVPTERQLRLWLTEADMAEGLNNQCLKFHVQASDVADAALWLASRSARAVTGQAIVVDGGWI